LKLIEAYQRERLPELSRHVLLLLGALLGLMLAPSGQAKASLVFAVGSSNAQGAINVAIDDRTDTITATIDGKSVTVIRAGESITFAVEITPIFLSLASASRDLVGPNEPGGGPGLSFSDRLRVQGIISNNLFVTFASDPAPRPSQGDTVFAALTETGAFQPLFFATATDFLGNTAVVNFSVASALEPQPIPEPATLASAFIGLGLFGTGFWWRRRLQVIA
jgi:hypothetical protein